VDAPIDQDSWLAVRTSLKQNGDRFADLVAAAPDPQAMATAHWSVADTAAHVLAVVWLDSALLPGAVPLPIPGLPERLSATTVDGIHDLNERMLRHITERDPGALAAMVRDHIGLMLENSGDCAPDEPVAWVGGSRMPLAGLFAHLLNEVMLHGYDLGRATGRDWPMAPQDAAPFFEMFIAGLARFEVGHLLDGGDRPRKRRIAVEFRSDHTTAITLVLQEGRVTAEPPGGAADVRLTFDPVTMSMMMFGRVGKAKAVLGRKVKIGGPRPWLLPIFLKTFRVPS
jgi:uncharacterized protein (TIGR03083 family)